jgi:hypothetical protein
MERSEELAGLMHAMWSEDVDGFESAALDDVLVIGAHPQEWWSGRETAVAAFRGPAGAIGGGFPVQAGDPAAYSEADVGWIADRPTLTDPRCACLPLRNEEAFGEELPT